MWIAPLRFPEIHPHQYFGHACALEAARKYGVKNKFVQISTDEVYGSLGNEGVFMRFALDPKQPFMQPQGCCRFDLLAYHRT